jgi:hypothetical protein
MAYVLKKIDRAREKERETEYMVKKEEYKRNNEEVEIYENY